MKELQTDKWLEPSFNPQASKLPVVSSLPAQTPLASTLLPESFSATQQDIWNTDRSQTKGQALACFNLGSNVAELTEQVLCNTQQDWLSDFRHQLAALPLDQLEPEVKVAQQSLMKREQAPKDDHEALAIQLLKITLADVLRLKQRHQPIVIRHR